MKRILLLSLFLAATLAWETPSNCSLSLQNVGSLDDGQLRYGYGTGASNVTFTLSNGYLTSSLGFLCYISSQTQLQCNTPPQTSADSTFSIYDGQLAYNLSTSWWKCDAGTGGSNLYTTQYYSHCTATTLEVINDNCTTASTSSSSCLSLNDVGSLCDGQLRLGYGSGANNVTFNLTNGYLTSSLNFICYISAQSQLQCNTPTQTTADTLFSISSGQLAYNGSTSWWKCDAGTGGSNLYTTQYYSQCTATVLTATTISSCPMVTPESCMAASTTSSTEEAATLTTEEAVTTSSEDTVSTSKDTSTTSESSNCFSLSNVGTLCDGQLRLGYGTGSTNVTFTLSNGYLTSSLGLVCYISSQTQLQCNTPPQTTDDSSFDVIDGQLSYSGSTAWYQCSAGTGGSNLYTTQYYTSCTAVTLTVIEGCYSQMTSNCSSSAAADTQTTIYNPTSSSTNSVTSKDESETSSKTASTSSDNSSTTEVATASASDAAATATDTAATQSRDVTSGSGSVTFGIITIVMMLLTIVF